MVNLTIAIYIVLQSKSPKVFADRLVYITKNSKCIMAITKRSFKEALGRPVLSFKRNN